MLQKHWNHVDSVLKRFIPSIILYIFNWKDAIIILLSICPLIGGYLFLSNLQTLPGIFQYTLPLKTSRSDYCGKRRKIVLFSRNVFFADVEKTTRSINTSKFRYDFRDCHGAG